MMREIVIDTDKDARSIRRIETIHRRRKWDDLEPFLLAGKVSPEMAEYAVNHPSLELIEVAWIVATPEQRQQFLARKNFEM